MQSELYQNSIQNTLGVKWITSQSMQTAMDQWRNLFHNNPPWRNGETETLNLAACIAGEFARLTTLELGSAITGSARADYLQKPYDEVLSCLRVQTEYAAAMGGLVFKPYLDIFQGEKHIAVDYVPADRFYPTACNARGEITGAVFVESLRRGKYYYSRLEAHQLTDKGYHIRNLAFRAEQENVLGRPVSLKLVEEWAGLEPELILRYDSAEGAPPERPLFAWFRIPFANQIDASSPLGVSVYSRAVELLKQADIQYSRILWEYEGSELAVDASDTALKINESGFQVFGKEKGNQDFQLPTRKKRLFRSLALQTGEKDFYNIFSPAIRDSSLFNGLNQLLRRIEFNCNLSYGTLSDPNNVDKTAEEIRSSKQRSYSAVCEIQKSLQNALEHLVWILDFYTGLYGLAPPGAYEVGFTWGDGILTDAETEFVQMKMLADSGYLKPEKLLSRYFGVTEEEARKEYMPSSNKTALHFEDERT